VDDSGRILDGDMFFYAKGRGKRDRGVEMGR
jgi:hypothetical protein